jgi:hypothetical protein
MSERWPVRGETFLERQFRERSVIMLRQATQQRMSRVVGLNIDFAWLISPTGPARDLEQRLCKALIAAKVCAQQSLIRVQNTDHRHAREVMAFRQHLRTDEYLSLSCLDIRQDLSQHAVASCYVPIESGDASCREKCRELVINALRAFADGDSLRSAVCARPVQRRLTPAVVTAQDTA